MLSASQRCFDGGSKRIEKLLHLSQREVNISIKPKQAPPDSHERGGLGPRGAPFDAQAPGKKPGNSVKNVDSDWSAGLCEVWGFYWSPVAGFDLKSDPHWPSAPSLDYRTARVKQTLQQNFLFHLCLIDLLCRDQLGQLCLYWRYYGTSTT